MLAIPTHDPWSYLEEHPQDLSSFKHQGSQALIRYIFLPILSYFASHHNYAVSNESWGSLTNSQYVVFLIAFGPIITSKSNVICLPNINSKCVCLIKEWTLLWLWPVLCSTSASRSSSVLPFPLVSPFWTSLEVHLPPYLIYLLPAHIHHRVWILWLEFIWSYPSKH